MDASGRAPLAFRATERRSAIDAQEPVEEFEIGVELDGEEPFWRRVLKTEPALVRGFVAALIALLISYGVPISEDQKVNILGFIAALLMLIQAWTTRQAVTSPATVEQMEAEAEDAIVAAYEAGVADGEAVKDALPAPAVG